MAEKSRLTSVRTGSLRFDPKNPRLPAELRSNKQKALLQSLLENEDVLSLAKAISAKGLFQHERMIVRQQGKLFYVLEGNRRLCAIKLLINPELAPTKRQVTQFRRLSEAADIQALSKIDVEVVDDRYAAAGVLASLHIGQSKKRWSSLQQARFFRELVDEGMTVDEIAAEVGQSLSYVREYLRSEELYRVALTLDYDADTRAKVESSDFPLTTLERFVDSKTARKAMGIAINEDGEIEGTAHPERFKAVLQRVVSDVATEKNLTRRVNREKDFKQYFEEIEVDLPDTPKRGSFAIGTLLGERPEPSEDDEPPPPKPKNPAPKTSKSIVPVGFTCTSSNDRVRQIFGELKAMPIKQRRNSTGVMLRVLMDIALWHFLVEQKHWQAALDDIDKGGKKRKHNKNWTPPLRQLIGYVCENTLLPGVAADGYKSVKLLLSGKGDDVLTIDGFNQFTHNRFVTPTEAELRELWARAAPMLEVILNEQQSEGDD